MKNKYKHLLIVFLSGLFMVSCTDNFLNLSPEDEPSPSNFFEGASSAAQAVTAIYQPWTRSANMYQRDLVIMFDAMTDDEYWRPSRSASIQQAEWNITSSNGAISDYWNRAYQSINAANFAIEGIPTSADKTFTAEDQKAYIAEARFMRGFDYLFLVSLWGDVPLITHQLKDFKDFDQPRSPKAEVYKQIISDFEYAKVNLPKEQSSRKGAPTKATAAAYLAKAYLYSKDYPHAETAARDAISIAAASGYHMLDDYMSIWDINNEGNAEELFYIAYVRNNPDYSQNMTVERLVRDCPAPVKSIYGNGDGWGYSLPQRSLYDAFEPGDPRRGYTLFSPGDFYGIYSGSTPFTYRRQKLDAQGDTSSTVVTVAPGDSVFYNSNWSPTGLSTRKMISNLEGLTNVRWAGQDVPLMRMSDLYLFLAEALAEQNNPEALKWVNKVRSRPSVDMPPRSVGDGRIGDDNLVDIVRHERRVELGLEGERLFDLLRWGTLKKVFGNGKQVKRSFFSDKLPDSEAKSKWDSPQLSKYGDNQVLFPIPQSEIDQNSKINSNNPGY